MRKLGFWLLLVPFASLAQKIESPKAEAVGDKIIISYDLTQGVAGDKYTVSLFASHNNFSAPISKVLGDVGQNIKEGKGKRIEWESKAEIGKYSGPLTFEIEVKVIAAFALKTELIAAKRGKIVPLTWRGGDLNQNVKIELLNAGVVAETIATATNKGMYDWEIPTKQKPGKEYSLRFVNGTETVSSPAFAIKPKYSIWMKAALPVTGVLVWILIPKPCKEDCGNEKLIGPPDILD